MVSPLGRTSDHPLRPSDSKTHAESPTFLGRFAPWKGEEINKTGLRPVPRPVRRVDLELPWKPEPTKTQLPQAAIAFRCNQLHYRVHPSFPVRSLK